MAAQARSPVAVLFTLVAVLAGIWLGLLLLRGTHLERARERIPETLRDLHIIDGSGEDFAAAGRPLGTGAPRDWSAIHWREYEAGNGDYLLALRCRIGPVQVDQVYDLPPGHRQPVNDRPPSEWPWFRTGVPATSPWRLPDWWAPAGDESAILTRPDTAGGSIGWFINYERASETLHLWQWRRADWPQPPPHPHLTADLLVQSLSEDLVSRRHPVDANGWLNAPAVEVPPGEAGIQPPGLVRVDAAIKPTPGDHRYLLTFHGLDAATAEVVLADTPLRRLPADSPPPVDRWDFARQPAGLPSWFTPGPGPRWCHHLLRPGPGTVAGARWAAYDPARRRLYVWDWAESTPRPATVRLDRETD